MSSSLRTAAFMSAGAAVLAGVALMYALGDREEEPQSPPTTENANHAPAPASHPAPETAAHEPPAEAAPAPVPEPAVSREEWETYRSEVETLRSRIDGLLGGVPLVEGEREPLEVGGESAGESAAEASPATASGEAEGEADSDIADQPALDRLVLASELVEVLDAVDALRGEFGRLQERVQSETSRALARLEEENRTLRDELRRAYAQGEGPAGLNVPRPGRDVLKTLRRAEEPAKEPPAEAQDAERPVESDTGSAVPAAGEIVRYDVVSEWGRTPEVAAQVDGGASSLAGMICVVDRGVSRDALVALGRHLRAQYDAYDNIAIDVYNDRAAAETAASDMSAAGPSRVLTISRSKAAGRDLMMVYYGGTAEVVQPTAI